MSTIRGQQGVTLNYGLNFLFEFISLNTSHSLQELLIGHQFQPEPTKRMEPARNLRLGTKPGFERVVKNLKHRLFPCQIELFN